MYFLKADQYGALYGVGDVFVIVQHSTGHLVHGGRIIFHQFQKRVRVSGGGFFYQLYHLQNNLLLGFHSNEIFVLHLLDEEYNK